MNLTKDQQKNTMLCRGRNRILVLAFGVKNQNLACSSLVETVGFST